LRAPLLIGGGRLGFLLFGGQSPAASRTLCGIGLEATALAAADVAVPAAVEDGDRAWRYPRWLPAQGWPSNAKSELQLLDFSLALAPAIALAVVADTISSCSSLYIVCSAACVPLGILKLGSEFLADVQYYNNFQFTSYCGGHLMPKYLDQLLQNVGNMEWNVVLAPRMVILLMITKEVLPNLMFFFSNNLKTQSTSVSYCVSAGRSRFTPDPVATHGTVLVSGKEKVHRRSLNLSSSYKIILEPQNQIQRIPPIHPSVLPLPPRGDAAAGLGCSPWSRRRSGSGGGAGWGS
uniref:Uncharacterized protein n=1 Tax=Oryza glaberrima TaxID=4538 RepID=I1Q445_ORYGL